jgi:serine/threonine-protein phosphatase 2A regulatory subunit B'
VPVPPPKGSVVPANPAYQGSLKSGANSSPSSSSHSLGRAGGAGSSGESRGSSLSGSGSGGVPDRRGGLADKTGPAPPIVVVSSEMPQDPMPHPSLGPGGVPLGGTSSPPPAGATVPTLGLGPSSGAGAGAGLAPGDLATPPKAGALNRLRQGAGGAGGPKDTIPITSKTPPRKQRSSRFHVTEKVELEKLPNFGGECDAWSGHRACAACSLRPLLMPARVTPS